MRDLNQELRDWLHTQPDWLQHAAERQLATGTLSDSDLQACVSALKTPHGQAATTTRAFPGLTPSSLVTGELRLLELAAITGIENLGSSRPLAFGPGNLSVIYGHNGSGKSSYTRLLKKACGKPRARELRANVFQPPPPPESRTCNIRFRSAGSDKTVPWQATGQPIDELRAVDLFDAEEATAYLTTENAVTYTPPAVALLEALAAICDRVKATLQSEQERLVSALPKLPLEYANTSTGVAYAGLNPNKVDAVQSSLTTWDAADQQQLTQLRVRLETQDPVAQARAKRAAKAQVDQLMAHLIALAAAFSDDQLTALRGLRQDAAIKRRSAAESARISSVELEGIGTDTWRALWKAARAYSLVAYPGTVFPVTEDARCVLCNQQLDDAAQQRLKDFEAFVQGKIETEAAAAEGTYKKAIENLPAPWSSDELATRGQAGGLSTTVVIQDITSWCAQAATTREALLGHELTGPAMAAAKPAGVVAELQARSEALEAEAKQHEIDATEFDRAHASKEKLNLEARHWTSQQADAIRAELTRLREFDTYEGWKRLANSKVISTKATEIAEQVITDAFVDRFNAELKRLGASRIRVELVKTKTTKGKVLHKIRLKGGQTGDVLPEVVLSEGERRIVALAAFVADVVDKPNSAPFVFDDPISSLDHDYEWSVAKRLAELARERQVLVFTHRLSLFGALEDAAKKAGDGWKKRNLHKLCIESFSGISGHPATQQAFAADTATANNILLDRLAAAGKAGATSGASAYRELAQGICSDFRKLIERTVEEDLLNQIVLRHRRSIQTDNKLAHLTRISVDDCSFFDGLMTKYSCFEHSQSAESPVFIPDEAELRGDLKSLGNWREGFKKRPHAGGPHA